MNPPQKMYYFGIRPHIFSTIGHPVAQGLLNIMIFWPCVKPVTRICMEEDSHGGMCNWFFYAFPPYLCQNYWTCYIFLARINLPCGSSFPNPNCEKIRHWSLFPSLCTVETTKTGYTFHHDCPPPYKSSKLCNHISLQVT